MTTSVRRRQFSQKTTMAAVEEVNIDAPSLSHIELKAFLNGKDVFAPVKV